MSKPYIVPGAILIGLAVALASGSAQTTTGSAQTTAGEPKPRPVHWRTAAPLRTPTPEELALPPVSYQVVVNGKPQAHKPTMYSVSVRDNTVAAGAGGRADAKGIIKVPRYYFLDPASPQRIIAIKSGQLESLDQVYYYTRWERPKNFEDVNVVPVTTSSLKVKIALPQPTSTYEGNSMVVRVRGNILMADRTAFSWVTPYNGMKLPVTPEIEFKWLQQGPYQIQLELPGAKPWLSPVTNLGASPVELQAQPVTN